MADQELDDPLDAFPQPKRFKYQSYQQALKDVHLPSTFKQSHLDHEVGDNESHFHEALDHWRQLNLSPSFIQFAKRADGLSASMPLLLHNWREIYTHWYESFKSADDEGLRVLLDLLQMLAHDLRTTLSPIYTELLQSLLSLLPRSISPPALTTLLETLASIFRYLLVPDINTALLEETWKLMSSTLPKCQDEIQRAVAEVWGAVLRRMKTNTRERAVLLLAEHTREVPNASAWVVVYACRSVSQTLHTCAASVFSPLLSYHVAVSDPKPTYTLLRRALTALIHHVKNSEQFVPVAELVVQKLSTTDKTDVEQLRRVVEVASVICSVRQGSRLTDAHKVVLFADLNSLAIIPVLYSSILRFATSLYLTSEMPLWLGPGLKFLQSTWNSQISTSFALKLNLCLADSGWSGWKLIAQPLVMKAIVKADLCLLDRELVGFLGALRRAKKLGAPAEVDVVWKKKIETMVIGRLKSGHWRHGSLDEAVVELDDMLVLSPYFSNAVTLPIIDIINASLDATDSDARVVGLCMQALSERDMSEWSGKVDVGSWARRCTERWASAQVLDGLVSLAQANPSTKHVPVSQIYPHLRPALISHSRAHRLAALRLLDSPLINPAHDQIEVLKRCLQGEEVSLDIQGVRERVLRIGRVGQVVGDEKGADLCARWLIAQLKVNLRPLWSPAAAALAFLGQRFGDLVWRLLFDEVKKIEEGAYIALCHELSPSPSQERGQEGVDSDGHPDDVDDPWEEERTWRDPSAHKVRSIVNAWDDPQSTRAKILKEQMLHDRLDLRSYEHQLLVTLGECSSLAEKHNRDLIPYFLSLNGPTDTPTSKLPKAKLISWLTLFSKFSNPKALHATHTLRTLYTNLLSHSDRSLQTIALSCLFTYKSPHLVPYEERIRALLDDTRWRDELALLTIDDIPASARAELIDVIIRLLFGVMLERKGRGRGADRRAAVLGALAGCADPELGLLVDLMMKPFGWNRSSMNVRVAEGGFSVGRIDMGEEGVSEKQVVGFLTLLGDVLKNLGSRLLGFWPALLGLTVNLTSEAQRRIDRSNLEKQKEVIVEGDDMSDEEMENIEDSQHTHSPSRLARTIRQLGLKRFADFFRIPVIFDFSPYMGSAFASFISPRLPLLDLENTQAPSALLELFYVWTVDGIYITFLVDYDSNTLPKIYDCLVATNVKPSVISRIFDIVDNLLRSAADEEQISEHVLKPHISRLLSNLSILVERTKGVSTLSTPLGQRQIFILSEIAQYSIDANQASTLLELFNPLLRRPSKFVPEKVKANLVKIIGKLLRLIPDLSNRDSSVYQKTYGLLAQLFQSLKSRPARLSLVSAFQRLAEIDTGLSDLANLLEAMNSYSLKRLDEFDFERRLEAFTTLNERSYQSLSTSDWLPVLYNMLNFIQDAAELAVRNNASYAMRHFIDFVAAQISPDYDQIFLTVLYPGLKNGLRSKNELVRVEVLGVIAYAVEKCEHISSLQEMRVLLEGGDEEANFFNNILHVQVHRRSRALRRLADHCNEGHLRSSTIAEIFVPLVGNYITSTTSADHHLVTDAILATGRMSKRLSWGGYYALVQKYLKLSRAKDESERVYIRALVSLLDNFHFSMDETVAASEGNVEGDEDEDDMEGVHQAVNEPTEPVPPLPDGGRSIAQIADAVNVRLLPNLLNHLEKYDATTDDNTRIPIAIGIVTVAKHLPAATREAQITRLLTILSQILRSRSQETRDLTRESLSRIAANLGPDYLPVLFRELRAALLRGPQLHVLAVVGHSIILHITTGENAANFPTLDNCVNDVAYVSAEVIFGESGKDVQSEDFKTKMREVRASSSRGLDSFAIMAKHITPSKVSSLLAPLKAIMHETESIKVMGLVDEVLRRISTGLNGNLHLVPTELITLCHTLITQNARFLQQTPSRRKTNAKGEAIVQTKRQIAVDVDHYANNSYRFVAFGLDLLHIAFKRTRFDFRDAAVMTRLESMIVVVGNTLYSTNSVVLTLGMRCAASLVKCPLKTIQNSLPVFVRQILDIVKSAGNTESELVQVAFKCLATILRDGPPVQVKEKDLVFLIELLSPDLEEPDRQASVFTLLRAIVARKFVVPEIYDLMEKVSEVSVTSQSPQVQELCRGVLLQFLLDYPQGKGRLGNQMAFFAKNLSYVHETGRASVMEILSAVIVKFQANLIQEYADLLFVALVMVLANDESAKCREMAAHLVKNLWTRLDDERRGILFSHLHSWASQTTQPLLTWVSAQVYGFVVDVMQAESASYIPAILHDLKACLHRSATSFVAEQEDEENVQMEVEMMWQLPYHSLTVLSKVLRIFPTSATEEGKISWNLVVEHLLFPHAWVRTAACRLLGHLFSVVPVAAPRTDVPEEHPFSRAGMQEIARKLTQQLKSEHLDEASSLQIVKNLFYLGKCFCLIQVDDSRAIGENGDNILDKDASALVNGGQVKGVEDALRRLHSPLPWLFSKLSYQIKSGHIARRNRAAVKPNWSQQPLAGLRWFAAMSSHMEPQQLENFLIHMLTPIYRLTEDDTIRDSQMEELKTTAVELQDLIQSRVGATKFSNVYSQIRQSALGVRRERKVARVLQATTNPEAAAKRKMQRNIIKKDSRKRKESGFLEAKGKFKRRKQE
ncbi:unnamed protein product [Cyclocybe aegerita]|uniref:U3 small nucleolar RNA-associated protein 20 n=1 Tax=Cyclocybe aegerita TaxID=1973307 RepID=A0A8S0XME6_CYCAE|nr:unnamed protein product [Cyclocybe aegerita]